MTASRAGLSAELSKLVVEALVKIGLAERDFLGGAIVHTELPWQVPPLVVEATCFGAPLSEYLDRSTHVNTEALTNLYGDVLLLMRNSPREVLNSEGYRSVYAVIPHVRQDERQLRFSLPDGFPDAVSDYAGATFAMECAHLLHINARLKAFVSDDDNYLAVLPDDTEVGIKDGLPTLCADQWDMSIKGMVQELIRQPRGALWEGCDYNIISQVRSVCKVWEKDIVEFEAIDWALQALRVVDGAAALLKAVRSIKMVQYERTHRMAALREAKTVSEAMALTDRQRIETLKNLLVPDILSPAQFTKQLYSFYTVVPPVVAPKVLARIQEAVAGLLEHEEMLYARSKPGINYQP